MGKQDWSTDFGFFFLLFLRCRGTVSVLAGAIHFNILDEVSVIGGVGEQTDGTPVQSLSAM